VATITYLSSPRSDSSIENTQNQELTAMSYGVMLGACRKRAKRHVLRSETCVTAGLRDPPRTDRRKWESAGKPGSVLDNHSSGMHVAMHLERPTREHARAARCRPEQAPVDPFPYLALLRAGFAVPRLLPDARCALTAPFHPYQPRANPGLRRFAFCCTFRGLAPPRRYLAPYPMEPGLSSPGLTSRSGCLADSRAHDRRAGPEPQAPGFSGAGRSFLRASARS